MAFLKGLTAEDMEVRVYTVEDYPAEGQPQKDWERSVYKHFQADIRVDLYPAGESCL